MAFSFSFLPFPSSFITTTNHYPNSTGRSPFRRPLLLCLFHLPRYHHFFSFNNLEIGSSKLASLALASNHQKPQDTSLFCKSSNSTLLYRLLIASLNFDIPYNKLFGQYILITNFFGCACFPFLRLDNNNKLQFRYQACVFFGYSIPPYSKDISVYHLKRLIIHS